MPTRSLRRFAAVLLHVFAPLATAQTDPALVTWGNARITQQDFLATVNANVPEANRAEFLSDMKRITQVLDQLQVQRTLANEARAQSLDKDPLVQRELALAAERILAGRRMAAFESSLKRPSFAAAAEDQYKLRLKQFEVPENVEVSHILVTPRNRSEAEARTRAEEARAAALAGKDFAALAREYSEDPSVVRNGGNLGLVPRGRTVKPFEDAAFALAKPGDISAVVQTQFGFHVIKLESRQAARQRSFEEVRAQLLAELEERWVDNQRAEYLSKIRNDPSIKLNTDQIEKLLTAPPARAPAAAPAAR